MTGCAELTCGVCHGQETAVGVVMGIMAGCTLHLPIFQADVTRECRRGMQLPSGRTQGFTVDKGNRMIVAQIG